MKQHVYYFKMFLDSFIALFLYTTPIFSTLKELKVDSISTLVFKILWCKMYQKFFKFKHNDTYFSVLSNYLHTNTSVRVIWPRKVRANINHAMHLKRTKYTKELIKEKDGLFALLFSERTIRDNNPSIWNNKLSR